MARLTLASNDLQVFIRQEEAEGLERMGLPSPFVGEHMAKVLRDFAVAYERRGDPPPLTLVPGGRSEEPPAVE